MLKKPIKNRRETPTQNPIIKPIALSIVKTRSEGKQVLLSPLEIRVNTSVRDVREEVSGGANTTK